MDGRPDLYITIYHDSSNGLKVIGSQRTPNKHAFFTSVYCSMCRFLGKHSHVCINYVLLIRILILFTTLATKERFILTSIYMGV